MEDIKSVIADNISSLRTSFGMTQLELAQKLHYSDKAVSKWERGESVPEISTLKSLAELFSVTVDYLLHPEHDARVYIKPSSTNVRNHSVITAMSVLLVWFVSLLFYVVVDIFASVPFMWLVFIYSVPASCIVWLVFNSIWFNKRRNYFIISLLTWGVIACVHLSSLAFGANVWQVYILGAPAQLVILLWSFLRTGKNNGSHGKISSKKEQDDTYVAHTKIYVSKRLGE